MEGDSSSTNNALQSEIPKVSVGLQEEFRHPRNQSVQLKEIPQPSPADMTVNVERLQFELSSQGRHRHLDPGPDCDW